MRRRLVGRRGPGWVRRGGGGRRRRRSGSPWPPPASVSLRAGRAGVGEVVERAGHRGRVGEQPVDRGRAVGAGRARGLGLLVDEGDGLGGVDQRVAGPGGTRPWRPSSEARLSAVKSRSSSSEATRPVVVVVVEEQLGGLGGLGAEVVEGGGDVGGVAVAVAAQLADLVEAAGGVVEQRGALALVAGVDLDLGVLDPALERVEGVAGQRALGGHGHRRGGADDGEPADRGGEAALAAAGALGRAAGVRPRWPSGATSAVSASVMRRLRRSATNSGGASAAVPTRSAPTTSRRSAKRVSRESWSASPSAPVENASTSASNSSARRRAVNAGVIGCCPVVWCGREPVTRPNDGAAGEVTRSAHVTRG